ncbi:MAG: helix-turn-helix transcriptional regulator [Pseudomonadota bacterium]
MINRIRDIRKRKGLTLAELADACDPPTTAQTIGRIETGMRSLSLKWMDRIGKALGVDPEILVRSEGEKQAQVIAELTASGPQALAAPRDIVLPTELASRSGSEPLSVIEVSAPIGEYRGGDLVWLRQVQTDQASMAINRDCLVPRPGGRFAFGRMIDRRGSLVGILPAETGQKQLVIDDPPWIAVAEMLVRRL